MAGDRFEEIWVEAGEKRLRALIHGERGWLMYLSAPGAAAQSSRNPDYAGPADATIEYCLSNGQRDVRPASWAYPVDVVRQALDFFEREEKLPPFIAWQAD
ncbi:MAG TPA: Imm1 family immunity protein [Polyangiaceae bacterium]